MSNFLTPAIATALIITSCTWGHTCPPGGPENDSAGTALSISAAQSLRFNTSSASSDGPPNLPCLPWKDLWWRNRSPADGELTITVETPTFDSAVSVYDLGTSSTFDLDLLPLLWTECANERGPGGETVAFRAVSGAHDLVQVGGFDDGPGAESGGGEITASMLASAAGACLTTCPAGSTQQNDGCGGVLPQFDPNGGCNMVPASFQHLGTVSVGAPRHACGTVGTFGGSARDLDWFTFTLDQASIIEVNATHLTAADEPAPNFTVFIIDGFDCDDSVVRFAAASSDCPFISDEVLLPPGTHTVIFTVNSFGPGEPACPVSYVGTVAAVLSCGSPDAGHCDEIHADPFCNDAQCCLAVCAVDPICCAATWDFDCVSTAALSCSGAAVTTSLPGAIGVDGSFYVLQAHDDHLSRVWKWDNGADQWQFPPLGAIAAPPWGLDLSSRPAGRTSTGGFFAIVKAYSNPSGGWAPAMLRWEPGIGMASLQPTPASSPNTPPPAPSASVSDRFTYTVVTHNGNEKLFEYDSRTATWTHHAGKSPRYDSPVCLLAPSHLFMASDRGHLIERWKTPSGSWAWGDHANPTNWTLFNRPDAVHVGGAMPSNKVFVTFSDGSLWQRWWDGGHWRWHPHGIPFGWRVDSPAVAVADGKLFVTGDWDHAGGNTRVLLQLYWNGSSWTWYPHGSPPSTSIAEGGAAATIGGDHVVVKGTDGNFHMCWWNGSAWAWKNCGAPPR